MATPIPARQPAKLTMPPGDGHLRRERLLSKLDEATGCVWVSSPAGTGKTTLISTWLETRGRPFLWYRLDADDADLATFFDRLSSAMEQRLGASATLPRLDPRSADDAQIGRYFFQALFAQSPGDLVLVLDDYQEIADGFSFHTVLKGALGERSGRILLVVIGREEPPRALARWTAGAGFCSVGADELRLTDEEAKDLARLAGVVGADDEMVAWNALARGWAAALTLMLRARAAGRLVEPSAAEIVDVLFDYFEAEVFRGLPFSAQDILLVTSVLPFVTAEWAQELSGLASSKETLAWLDRNRIFVDRDPRATRYAYHPLFREFLLEYARRERAAAEMGDLNRRAAVLLERDGETEAAAALFGLAGEWAALGRLIARHAPALLHQGRLATLEAWIMGFPEEVREAEGWLLYWLGSCRSFRDPRLGRASLERAYRRFRAGDQLAGQFLTAAAIVGGASFEPSPACAADPFIDELEGLWRTNFGATPEEVEVDVLCFSQGLIFRRPDHARLPALAHRAETLARSRVRATDRLAAGTFALHYFVWTGNLVRAKALAMELATARHEASGLARILFTMWWGVLLSHEGEYDAANVAFAEALEISGGAAIAIFDPPIYAEIAETALRAGDPDAAERALDAGCRCSAARPSAEMQHFRLLRAAVLLAKNQVDEAASAAREAFRWQESSVSSPFCGAVFRLVLGQISVLAGEHAEGRQHLFQVLDFSRRMPSAILEFDALLALAFSHLEDGDAVVARTYLEAAIELGRERGYKSTRIAWVPQVMARLCSRALEHDLAPDFVRALIRRHALRAESPDVDAWPWPIRIYTLGRFAVVIEGERLTFPRKAPQKPLELLKALVARGGRGADTRDLCEQLWPDLDGDATRNAFDVTLHRLRKLLGSDAVLVQDGKLALDHSRVWVDAWAFEKLSGAVDRWKAESISGTGLESATERLLRFYTGHFLAGEDPPWAIAARERLRSKFLRAVSKIGEQLERRAGGELVTTLYRRAIELDPLAEELHRGLILSFRAQNRTAEAIDAYRRCRDLLTTALGVEPSAPTRAVYLSLKELGAR